MNKPNLKSTQIIE